MKRLLVLATALFAVAVSAPLAHAATPPPVCTDATPDDPAAAADTTTADDPTAADPDTGDVSWGDVADDVPANTPAEPDCVDAPAPAPAVAPSAAPPAAQPTGSGLAITHLVTQRMNARPDPVVVTHRGRHRAKRHHHQRRRHHGRTVPRGMVKAGA
jgi:hypothetical protein